jgi:hypothetical protein
MEGSSLIINQLIFEFKISPGSRQVLKCWMIRGILIILESASDVKKIKRQWQLEMQ